MTIRLSDKFTKCRKANNQFYPIHIDVTKRPVKHKPYRSFHIKKQILCTNQINTSIYKIRQISSGQHALRK